MQKKETQQQPDTLNPADYFNVVLPTMLRWKGPAAEAAGAVVCFIVNGKGGGTWTIRLRPPKAGVLEGNEWKADLTIRITSQEMCHMLKGTFDAKRAIGAGAIELEGDMTVLKRVGFLFQSGGTQVETRLKTKK